jgi:hypothetical protein
MGVDLRGRKCCVQCTQFESDTLLTGCYYELTGRSPHEVAAMDRDTRKCLERAAECARLADDEWDPELKAYLIKLASSWVQVATAETDERFLEARRTAAK